MVAILKVYFIDDHEVAPLPRALALNLNQEKGNFTIAVNVSYGDGALQPENDSSEKLTEK